MGLFKMSSSSLPETTRTPPARAKGNPNPSNWKVQKAVEHGIYLIVQLQYPDCANYEGSKILVFENLTLVELVNQKKVDPHFFKGNKKFRSPIARFEPTERGWKMAETFVKAL